MSSYNRGSGGLGHHPPLHPPRSRGPGPTSPSFGQSTNARHSHTPQRHQNGSSRPSSSVDVIDDTPIQTFISTIQTLPPDEWRCRTGAFEELVNSIPNPPTSPPTPLPHLEWYNSPPTLRRLNLPISTLLTDARSTVIKSTASTLVRLIASCSDHTPDCPRHLLKDLLPTILGMHGQTVNVIRGYAKSMMLDIIQLCKFKSGLPVILERMRRDKSRDVREVCGRYLRAVIECWPGPAGSSPDGKGASATGYLTSEILNHIGTALARALSDPSQCVRMEARTSFEVLRNIYPNTWSDVVHKEGGVISRDVKLKRQLLAAAERADRREREAGGEWDNDDMSIGSRGSVYSRGSVASNSVTSSVFGNSTVGGASRRRGQGAGPPGRIQPGTRVTIPSSGSLLGGGGASSRRVAGASSRVRGISTKNSPTGIQSPTKFSHSRVSSATGGRGGSNRLGAPVRNVTGKARNAFSATILESPPDEHTSSPPAAVAVPAVIVSSSSQAGSGPLSSGVEADNAAEAEIRTQAAIAIQAAARGVATRSSILLNPESAVDKMAALSLSTPVRPCQGATEGTPEMATPGVEKQPSVELDMIRSAQTALKLGMTAEQMANRRKTQGGSIVLPVPPSPGGDLSIWSAASFATTNADAATGGSLSPESRFLSPPMKPRFVEGSGPAGAEHRIAEEDDHQAAAAVAPAAIVKGQDELLITPPPPPSSRQHLLRHPSSAVEILGPDDDLRTLRKKAQDRKSSSALQLRLRRSSVGVGDSTLPVPSQQQQPLSPVEEEHMGIAHALLDAHRHHVDRLMGTLRMEMDVIRDFEQLLSLNKDGADAGTVADDAVPDAKGNKQHHLTEDDVLDYFESVALCLDQRTVDGDRLRFVMDKISQGESRSSSAVVPATANGGTMTDQQ